VLRMGFIVSSALGLVRVGLRVGVCAAYRADLLLCNRFFTLAKKYFLH
jgi:hypothetical protein